MVWNRRFFQMPDLLERGTTKGPPITLDYGKTAYFSFPLDEFLSQNAITLCAKLPTILPSLAARFLFVEIGTSGNPSNFRFRVDPLLGRELAKSARQRKLNNHRGSR